MSNVDGWAFKDGEKELAFKNQKEDYLFTLEGKHDWVVVENVSSGYAQKTYTGYLKEGHPPISLKELLIHLDGGNLCFGGRGSINGDRFTATVYTD